jgi:peptidoglycan/xylan/chitin deacetylase (PgdA/CDA1 family)
MYKLRSQQIQHESGVAGVFISNNLQSSPLHTGEAYALPVLVYHSVENRGYEEYNLDRVSFANQLFALKKGGWQTVTLKEFEAFMRGELSLPERSFLLTFDDGTKKSFHPVTPLLQTLDYTAVTFILPKHSIGTDSHYYVSTEEIKTMLSSGLWEIGSHGYDIHEYAPTDSTGNYEPPLTHLLWLEDRGRVETDAEYTKRVTEDLLRSQELLENTFDVPITAFAFPFGEFGRSSSSNPSLTRGADTLASLIYESSFYQWWPGEGLSFNYRTENPIHIYKRIEPKSEWAGEDLLQYLEAGLPKTLPYISPLREDEGWLRNWGTVDYRNNMIELSTLPQGTGAAIYLDGSGHWKDYTVTATITSPTQTGVSLVFRFFDYNNQALCNFGQNFVHIEQLVAGSHKVIQGVREEDTYLPSGVFTVEAKVSGRTVSCGINGTTLVTTKFLDPTLSSGGVGIKTWSPELEKATLIIESFTIEPL